MDQLIKELAIAGGQLITTAGFLIYMIKRINERVEDLRVDIAIVKEMIRPLKGDHDTVVAIEATCEKCQEEIGGIKTFINDVFKVEYARQTN